MRKTLLFFLLTFYIFSAKGQSLIDIIEKTEKAIFETRSYITDGPSKGTASGFFISPDGLAITSASIFEHADSATIILRNGRDYKIERILSVHPYTNLALVKVEQNRQKQFEYLIPSKQSYREEEEALVFNHLDDSTEGSDLITIKKIAYFPFISRTGIINGMISPKSNGAPAINYRGEVFGIIKSVVESNQQIVYNTYLLNDSNWIDINTHVRDIPDLENKKQILGAEKSRSISHIITENFVESARIISRYIKEDPTNAEAYSIRAYARHKYKNNVGSRADLSKCYELDADYFLQFYFKGLFLLEKNEKREALINFELCNSRQPTFAPALVRLAMLQLANNKNIRATYRHLSEAVLHDSLEAGAFYERARLRMQHSADREATLDDINQTIYLDPSYAGIFTLRGIIKSEKEDMLGAISDFNKAIEKDKNDTHAYFNRGIANYNIGLKKEACEDWNKAGELGNFKAYNYISRYCKDMNKGLYPSGY